MKIFLIFCEIFSFILTFNGASIDGAAAHGATNDGAPISVAVIGAGVGGLSAARFLLDFTGPRPFNVTVYEANPDRYGGRIWSYSLPGLGQ